MEKGFAVISQGHTLFLIIQEDLSPTLLLVEFEHPLWGMLLPSTYNLTGIMTSKTSFNNQLKTNSIVKNFIFESIDEILQNSSAQLAIPLRQRAKFEGWLKIELAAKLYSIDADTKIEEPYPQCHSKRTDIVSQGFFIELKTVNTNCVFPNIPKKYKPFSKNVQKCVDDIKKIRQYKGSGIVAFVFFPVKDSNNLSIVSIKREIHSANFVDGMSCGSYYIFVAEI